MMNLPYSEELHIENLSRLFDNTSECYKFFWFKAIVEKVIAGENEISFEELVDDMIASAWYMVTEFHLNLGPKDTLESVVKLIKDKNPHFKSSIKKSELLAYLSETKDKEIISKKRTLILNVPYRLQAPFVPEIKGKVWDVPKDVLIENINRSNRIMYYFLGINGLSTKIVVKDEWVDYFIKNQEIVKGWLEYNMILYIQKRNPSVPGIADKLYPPQERKLEDIKKYWKLILTIEPVKEIYGKNTLTAKDISIDHFVPWSYVAHDEMWNLNPTTKSINSAKSNNLPDWDIYFKRLAKLEYKAYQMMWKYDLVRKEFEKCAKKHINDDKIKYRIYESKIGFEQFERELESVILPVYKSALNCGFGTWEYKKMDD
ncbi:HNH endonuclease domain-containing protein [Pseudobutyrivibrio ruminis]|nr:HNH endonuclease domain-containing protein [Pseudobutyrivibrio ruminis]